MFDSQVKKCTACDLHSMCNVPRPGKGLDNCSVMIISDMPTEDTNHSGYHMSTRVGMELERYLFNAGLQLENCYFTTLLKCRVPENDPLGKDQEIINGRIVMCSNWLTAEVKEVKPTVIITLGAFVSKVIVGAANADSFNLDVEHGIPVHSDYFGCSVIPTYSVGMALTKTFYMSKIQADINVAVKVLNDGMPEPEKDWYNKSTKWRSRVDCYEEINEENAVGKVCYIFNHVRNGGIEEYFGVDTEAYQDERGKWIPWCVTISNAIGEAYMIKASDTKYLEELNRQLNKPNVLTVLHNAMFDLPLLADMGIRPKKFTDTMVMAYLLQYEPQGLKALSYRHFRMKMQSFKSMMTPSQELRAVKYLKQVSKNQYPDPLPKAVTNKKGEIVLKQGKNISQKAKKLLDKFSENEDYDLLKSWNKIKDDKSNVENGVTWTKELPTLGEEIRKAQQASGESHTQFARICSIRPIDLTRVCQDKEKSEYILSCIIKIIHNKFSWCYSDSLRQLLLGKESISCTSSPLGILKESTVIDAYEHDPKALLEYACRDADATFRLYRVLSTRIWERGLQRALEIDIAMIPMILEMQNNGMPVNEYRLLEVGAEFNYRILILESKIKNKIGYDFLLSSPQQMAKALYEHLGLPILMKTATKLPSTCDDALALLDGKHDVIPLIRELRSLATLRNDHVNGMFKHIEKDGRVHPDIRTTKTVTGRLSCASPNLQNVPTRTEDGKKIRRCFQASEGWKFVAADYSGIEMRVLAHVSRDEKLIGLINDGIDIHSWTASKIFKIPIDRIEKEERIIAKTLGFGIAYLITPEGLYNGLQKEGYTDWDIPKCAELIRYWYDLFQGVHKLHENVVQEAKRYGYVKNEVGRLRLIPQVRSTQPYIADEGKRFGCNFVIQGLAQDIMKKAMIDMIPYFNQYDWIRFMIQIHDDVTAEVRKDHVEEYCRYIKKTMENSYKLCVPIDVEIKVGSNWADMEVIEV